MKQLIWRISIPSRLTPATLSCLSLFLAGCSGGGLLPYSLNTPATVLHPVGQPSIIDGRARFREIVCEREKHYGSSLPDHRPCEEMLHKLSDEPVASAASSMNAAASHSRASAALPSAPSAAAPSSTPPAEAHAAKNLPTVVFVPGFLGECYEHIATPFSDTHAHLKSLGYGVESIHTSGRSSSQYNAVILKEALSKLASDRLIIVAYSKGVSDMLEMLALYPALAKKIQALVSVAGVVSGTPLADHLLSTYETVFARLPLSVCPPGDGRAMRSVTRETRMNWLIKNKPPASIRLYSLVAFTERSRISGPLRIFYNQLAEIDPRNDGQVIHSDAILPGSTLLGYVNADHWAVALPFNRSDSFLRTFIDHNAFPREILMESILAYIKETTGNETATASATAEKK